MGTARTGRSLLAKRMVELAVATAGAVACTPPAAPKAKPSLLDQEPLPAEVQSPASHWYHPPKPAELRWCGTTDKQEQLCVGARGERWLASGGKQGHASAAPWRAPEELVGALRSESSWAFIGASGVTYAASSPLGSFHSAHSPPRPLSKVRVGTTKVVGLTPTLDLLLSEDAGRSWREVPGAEHPFDLWMRADELVVLSFPEKLWRLNGGRRLEPVQSIAPLGARSLVTLEGQRVGVESALGRFALQLSPPAQAQRVELSLEGTPSLSGQPVRGPSATALRRGLAFFAGESYRELELGVQAKLWSGRLGEPLEAERLPQLDHCHAARVAGDERSLLVACARDRSSDLRKIEWWYSDSSRSELQPFGAPVLARLSQLRLQLNRTAGAALATGICPDLEAAVCEPLGVFWWHLDGKSQPNTASSPQRLATPGMSGPAAAMWFGGDETVYVAGKRTKGEELFVFSGVAGQSALTALPLPALPGGHADFVESVAPAPDGQSTLVIRRGVGAPSVVRIDSTGRAVSVHAPPVAGAIVGAYDFRALAVRKDLWWESADGGATWQSIGPSPAGACPDNPGKDCQSSIWCVELGCIIGDSVTRLGWQGQRKWSSLLRPLASTTASTPSIASTLRCKPVDATWSALHGAWRMPTAAHASLGNIRWFAAGHDDDAASAIVWLVDENGGEPRSSWLLSPNEAPEDFAYYPTLQVEGAAAIRYPIAGAPSTPRLIEVAWTNFLSGERVKQRVSVPGPWLPTSYRPSKGKALRADPDLLSITSGGVYLRPLPASSREQATYFVANDGASRVLPAYSWPPTAGEGRPETVRVSGAHLGVFFANPEMVIVRTLLETSSPEYAAATLGPGRSSELGIEQVRDIAYLDGAAGVHLTTRFPDGSAHSALYPFSPGNRVFAEPVRVPTQSDLNGLLTPCTSEQRRQTPRTLAAHQPGSRHVLFVEDSVESERVFLTEVAVLYGTPSEPCVAAFDAEGVGIGKKSARRESLLLETDGTAWLFRPSSEATLARPAVDVRQLECTPDEEAPIPREVYTFPDTLAGPTPALGAQ